jgi:carbamoyl-phosphate synthase small subunit
VDKYLILENGDVFKGKSFGYDGEAIGELVFTTKTTGYLETLSDPAYYGQIVLQTFPLIGNYGVITQDFGPGPMHLKAYIVRQWCQEPSNFRCEGNLDTFLCDHKIPGLYDIDTRALTRVIRDNGTLNAMLSNEPHLSNEMKELLKSYRIKDGVANVCGESNFSPGNYLKAGELSSNLPYNVVLWDFGDGFRSSELLVEYGCNPIVVNYASSAGAILNKNPNGIMLTGGPGDPSDYVNIINEVKKLIESTANIPIFAVGLGHQLLALANGAKTEKMKFGNRGVNQPVKERSSDHAFITKQNHGYCVVPESLPDNAKVSYTNINDKTCDGIDYTNIPAFSIQFEPTKEIMERFVNKIKEVN